MIVGSRRPEAICAVTSSRYGCLRKGWIHDEVFAASRLSMMRIMARRMKAATVVA